RDSDPARTKLADEARGAAILMMVMGGLVLILLGIVLIAVITAIVLAATGSIKRVYAPQPWANSAYVEAFAIYLVTFILLGLVMSKLGADALAWDWIALIL